MLLGLSQQVREDSAAERTDLANHATRNRGGERPAKRNELEGRSIARSQCSEAKHEEHCRGDQRRSGHQTE